PSKAAHAPRREGLGLAAVRRMADQFELHSPPGNGTAVLARFLDKPQGTTPCLLAGGLSLPLQGHKDCGDGWAMVRKDEALAILLVDGLGHGRLAAEPCNLAREAFLQSYPWEPGPFIERLNLVLRATRGAVLALAQ